MWRLVVALVVVSGCKTEADKPLAPPAPVVVAPSAVEPAAQPSRYDTKTLCRDSFLFLAEHPFDAMNGDGRAAGVFCKTCRDVDEDACGFDWPSSDVMPCATYDLMRNTIYAYHGRAFTKTHWQTYFASRSWYRVDPAYDDAALPAIARANVELMVELRAKCVEDMCSEGGIPEMDFMCEETPDYVRSLLEP